MPIPHDDAHQIAARLAGKEPIEALSSSLAPVSDAERSIPPQVPDPRDWSAAARDRRVAFLEQRRGVDLASVSGRAPVADPETLRGSIEQYVGMAQIPIGVIGPLRINGLHARDDYYVPLATSEGALVASYHRGARIATAAGGIAAITVTEKVQRAPAFVFETIGEAGLFVDWLSGQYERLRDVAGTRTRHGRLTAMLVHLEANHVYVVLEFHTGDAAGQNMVTLCTHAVCDDILARTPYAPKSWFLESNMSGDKKATTYSFQNTRGRKVVAEVVLPRALVESGLHTTVDRICEYWRVSVVGAVQAGAIGLSGHYANALAALFIACGQDAACVSEASVGITRLESTQLGDLYVGVTLPGLIVGTVGGGTRLPTARECLRLLDCDGDGKAARFAEICAATVLAGEISIAGSMAAGDFAQAHERLGRQTQR